MPESALSLGMVERQLSLSRIPLVGAAGDVRERIRPASIPSVCDVASSDCLMSLLRGRAPARNSSYVKAIVADSLASGPFEDFLLKNDFRKARALLNFWRDAQVRYEADKKLCCCRGTARRFLSLVITKVTFKLSLWYSCRSIGHILFPVSLPLQLYLHLAPFSRYYFPKSDPPTIEGH